MSASDRYNENNESTSSDDKRYLQYQYTKAEPNNEQTRWTGLDVEITVDKDWDKLLPDILSPQAKKTFLEKILCLVSKNENSDQLYLSRLTFVKADPKVPLDDPRAKDHYKIWYFNEELSPYDTEPHKFISLALTPELIQNAKVEKNLEKTGSSAYPSEVIEDVEDGIGSILIAHLSKQVETLIAAESLHPSGGTTFPLAPLKGGINDALKENLEALQAYSKALTSYLRNTPDITGNKQKRQLAEESIQDMKISIDQISRFLAQSQAREEQRQKEAEAAARNAVSYATYNYEYQLHGQFDRKITIRVDSKWDQTLPPDMAENEKQVLLNKLISHVLSKKYRATLPTSQDRFYTDLYFSRVMKIGDSFKGWFANTSLPFYEQYKPFAFELAARQLQETPGISLTVKRDDAYDDSDRFSDGYERKRDNKLRENLNEQARTLMNKELAYMAGVQVHLNPHWGDQLTHLRPTRQQELLNKMIYLACLENEKLSKTAGRATHIYVSQVTANENDYKLWFADLSAEATPVRTFKATEEDLKKVHPTDLDPRREIGKFSIERAHEIAGEEKRLFTNLDNKVEALVQEEIEERAGEKLEIDFFDNLSESLIDKRNKLSTFKQAYKQGSKREALIGEEVEEQEGGIDPELAELFNSDPETLRLKAEIKSVKAVIKNHLENESSALAEKEKILSGRLSSQYASVRQDALLDKTLFKEQLAIPLAQTLQVFIPKFLESVKKVELSRMEKIKFKKEEYPQKLQEKKTKALQDFYTLYDQLIGLDPSLNVDTLSPGVMKGIATKLSDQIMATKDRDILIEKINTILSKSAFLPTQQQEFAKLLRENLSPQLSNGAFKLTTSLRKAPELAADPSRMEALLKKERSATIKKERENFSKEIAEAATADQAVSSKLDIYQRKLDELKGVFEKTRRALNEQREKQKTEIREQAIQVNRGTVGDLDEVSQKVRGYITYLQEYFKIKPHDSEETQAAIIEARRQAEVNDAKSFSKIEAAGKLLFTLKNINKRILQLNASDPSQLTLEQNKILLANKIAIIAEVKEAFSMAQKSTPGHAKDSLEVGRGRWAKFLDKKSPKIALNTFFNPENQQTGMTFFVNKSAALIEKELALKQKIQEKEVPKKVEERASDTTGKKSQFK